MRGEGRDLMGSRWRGHHGRRKGSHPLSNPERAGGV